MWRLQECTVLALPVEARMPRPYSASTPVLTSSTQNMLRFEAHISNLRIPSPSHLICLGATLSLSLSLSASKQASSRMLSQQRGLPSLQDVAREDPQDAGSNWLAGVRTRTGLRNVKRGWGTFVAVLGLFGSVALVLYARARLRRGVRAARSRVQPAT